MKKYAIHCLLATSLLTGCASQRPMSDSVDGKMSDRDALSTLMSAKIAEKIKLLPPDADLESISDQITLIDQGMYLTWDGERRYINPADEPKAAQVVRASAAPKVLTKRAVAAPQESMVLDEVPAPINIE